MTALFDYIFPRRCGLCGFGSESAVCDVCASGFRPVKRLTRIAVDRTEMVAHYSGRAGQAVRRLKFGRVTSLVDPLALRLAERFHEEFTDAVDMIVPVPLHWTRRAYRGFNQAELLCRYLPRELLRFDVLRRVRATRPQATLSTEERLQTLRDAFAAKPAVRGCRILLVDDVATSGTTADECAKALRLAGATEVNLLVFAGSP